MTADRLARLSRLAILTAAALVPVMLARGGRDEKLYAAQIMLLIAAGGGAAAARGIARAAILPAACWAVAPLLAMAAAAARHGTVATAGGDLARHWVFLLAFFSGAALLAVRDLRRLAGLWSVTFVLVAAYAAAQKAGLEPLAEYRQFHSQSRPFATFGNPDFLGVHVAFLLPIFYAVILTRNAPGGSVWPSVLLLVPLAILLLTGSRGAWLGAFTGMLLTAGLMERKHDWFSVVRDRAGRIVIGLLLALLVFLAPSILKVITRHTDRIPLWQGTMAMVRARPLTGWGLGSFPAEFPAFAPPAFAAKMKADNTFAEHPHSEYLHIAVEDGLPVLGIFIWLIAVVVRRGLRRARDGDPVAAGAVGGLVAVLVHILVDRNFRLASTAVPFWLVAGALFALPRRAPEAGAKPPAWQWAALAGCFALAAVTLRPYYATMKVAREVDFLAQGAAIPAAQLEAERPARAADPAFLMVLGDAWAREKNFPRAINAYEDALKAEPGNVGAAINLGNCWFMMSRFDRAEEVFRGILARHPDHRDARFNLAMTYYYQRRIKSALAEVDILLRQDPVNAKALQLKQQLAP